MGLGDIRVFEVTVCVTGAVIGCVPLRGDPPNMRVDVGRQRVGAPLPANAEEHGRGRSPFGEREDNRHGIADNEVPAREVGAGSTDALEGKDGGACLQYALRLGGYPRLG